MKEVGGLELATPPHILTRLSQSCVSPSRKPPCLPFCFHSALLLSQGQGDLAPPVFPAGLWGIRKTLWYANPRQVSDLSTWALLLWSPPQFPPITHKSPDCQRQLCPIYCSLGSTPDRAPALTYVQLPLRPDQRGCWSWLGKREQLCSVPEKPQSPETTAVEASPSSFTVLKGLLQVSGSLPQPSFHKANCMPYSSLKLDC